MKIIISLHSYYPLSSLKQILNNLCGAISSTVVSGLKYFPFLYVKYFKNIVDFI